MTKKKQFMEYHRANPQVWTVFVRYCFRLYSNGNHKFSQRMVWETMRMDSMLSTTGELYKLNNNYLKFYAEMFLIKHPEYGDVFSLRGEPAIGRSSVKTSISPTI